MLTVLLREKWMQTKEAELSYCTLLHISLSFSPASPPTTTPLPLKLSYENLI